MLKNLCVPLEFIQGSCLRTFATIRRTRLVGDPNRLRQVLINLVGNAIKFTSKGEIVFAVASRVVGENEAMLGFSVQDTGIGIPEDKQASIFEAFAQAGCSTTRRLRRNRIGVDDLESARAVDGGTHLRRQQSRTLAARFNSACPSASWRSR